MNLEKKQFFIHDSTKVYQLAVEEKINQQLHYLLPRKKGYSNESCGKCLDDQKKYIIHCWPMVEKIPWQSVGYVRRICISHFLVPSITAEK